MKAELVLKICLTLFLLTTGERLAATIRYVRPLASGSGGSWANASGDLQHVINSSFPGDEVWVAAGTYSRMYGGWSFSMKEGIKIYGGFPNAGNPVFEDRDWVANLTILTGNGDGHTVIYNDPDNYFGIALTPLAVLDGFTITNANGRGMANYESSPTITNCIFDQNISDYPGGGIFNQKSSPVITNCTFSKNRAISAGGAVYNGSNSSPSFINCSFLENQSWNIPDSYYYGGGGIANFDCPSPIVITSCIFLGNTSTTSRSGGGIASYRSPLVITNCVFSGNQASSGGGIFIDTDNANQLRTTISETVFSNNQASFGGGINVRHVSSIVEINKCTFSNNVAPFEGGAIHAASSVQVINSSFLGNEAAGGGAIWASAPSLVFINCLIAGNIARGEGGGGLKVSSFDTSILNCTISGNRTDYYKSGVKNDAGGGGIFLPVAYPSSVLITNSIIHSNGNAQDQFDNIKDIRNPGPGVTSTVSYSIVQGGHPGTGNLDVNPDFRNPGSYTLAPDINGDYSLQSGSPAINVGSNVAYDEIAADLIDKDLAGNNRIGGATIDIGAYEWIDNNPLPVALVGFEALEKENTVVLNWQSAAETNLARYEIERSPDAKNWQKIGEVAPQVQNTGLKNYSFFDTAFPLFSTRFYYRLKMLDSDAAFEYSQIISIDLKREEGTVLLFPNPASGKVNIVSNIPVKEYRLFSILSVPLSQDWENKVVSGEIPIGHVPSGVYLIQLRFVDGSILQKKLVVSR